MSDMTRATRRGRNAERNFHDEKRKNDTHSSTTDPDAVLFRKGGGMEAKLCHMGHLITENRSGLIAFCRFGRRDRRHMIGCARSWN